MLIWTCSENKDIHTVSTVSKSQNGRFRFEITRQLIKLSWKFHWHFCKKCNKIQYQPVVPFKVVFRESTYVYQWIETAFHLDYKYYPTCLVFISCMHNMACPLRTTTREMDSGFSERGGIGIINALGECLIPLFTYRVSLMWV